MWSPIDKLGEDQLWMSIDRSNLHPYEIKTTLWSSALSFVVVGLLHLFLIIACMRELKNITCNSMTSSLLGCCLLSWSILLIASTRHLKCPSDHHFHVSLPSTTLGLPIPRAAHPSHREKWPLSKEPFLTLTWIALIDWFKWWT